MPFYMTQFRFRDDQWKALVEKPHDRTELVRHAVADFGGTLHHYFFAFGDYDGLVISEFPDQTAATAFLLMVEASGAVASLKTTVLIPTVEAQEAMKKAGGTKTSYRPPAGTGP